MNKHQRFIFGFGLAAAILWNIIALLPFLMIEWWGMSWAIIHTPLLCLTGVVFHPEAVIPILVVSITQSICIGVAVANLTWLVGIIVNFCRRGPKPGQVQINDANANDGKDDDARSDP